MQRLRLGVGWLVLVGGCAHLQPPTAAVPASASDTSKQLPAAVTPMPAAPAPSVPIRPPAASTQATAVKHPPLTPAPKTAKSPPASGSQKAAGAAPPALAAAQARPAAAPAGKPAAPALDLASLQQRLRETPAIGVFTKLSLKNQVDDLLAQFKGYFAGSLKVTLADLRQRYEQLLFKVLTLLQDGDPTLAAAVQASKEAIWGVLTDKTKLESL